MQQLPPQLIRRWNSSVDVTNAPGICLSEILSENLAPSAFFVVSRPDLQRSIRRHEPNFETTVRREGCRFLLSFRKTSRITRCDQPNSRSDLAAGESHE
jgi:hypothetical protein